jgi:DNA polymerase Ligase (LigD)
MPRYVILEHDFPSLHWDLMLESGPILRTWRLAQPPEHDKVLEAELAPDHRLVYLDYEGEISGGRGNVRRWDRGTFECSIDEPHRIICRCSGLRLEGEINLAKGLEDLWHFTFVTKVD